MSANSSLACLRVWSMVDSGVRVSPAASPSTVKRLTPAPVRAATMIRSAVWPSSTNIFVPLSTQPSPVLRGLHGDAALVPLAGRLGEGERGDRLAGGDAGQEVLLGGVVTAVQQRVGGEHDGREVGGAEQRPAHLLEHDAELDEAVARARRTPRGWRGPAGPSARPSATRRRGRSRPRSPSAAGPRSRATCARGRTARSCAALPAPR